MQRSLNDSLRVPARLTTEGLRWCEITSFSYFEIHLSAVSEVSIGYMAQNKIDEGVHPFSPPV